MNSNAAALIVQVCLVLAPSLVLGREIDRVIDGSPGSWATVRDRHYREGIATPCKDKSIPFEKSRMARSIFLSCSGGAGAQFNRKQEPFDVDTWLSWQLENDLIEMHNFRAQSSNINVIGEIDFSTQVKWQWTERLSGQNGSACGWDYRSKTCTRTVSDTQCTSDSPSSSPSGGGGYSPGGGGGYESRSSPWGSVDPKLTDPLRGEKFAEAASESAKQKMVRIAKQLSPIREAHAGCTTTYRTESYTCYDKIGRSCEWDVTRNESFHCTSEKGTYHISYQKPENSWRPHGHPDCGGNCDSNYHPLIPNKYDLLPGEREFVKPSFQGGQGVNFTVDIVNKWNEYRLSVSPSSVQCSIGMRPSFKAEIGTTKRIKRKSPNALTLPANKVEALQFNQEFANNKVLRGRPYGIKLKDESSEIVAAAAKISRTASAPQKNSAKAFWKDTQFRVRLIQIEPSRWKRDIKWTNDLYTDGSYVEAGYGNLKIPLEGNAGVGFFYRPSGIPLFLDTIFSNSSYGNIELTPGKDYELRVAMYQRGIPFYESGCTNADANCEGEKARDSAFSEDLIIRFTADTNIDNRTLFEKLLQMQRGSTR